MLMQFGQIYFLQTIGNSWHHTGIQDLPLQFSGNLCAISELNASLQFTQRELDEVKLSVKMTNDGNTATEKLLAKLTDDIKRPFKDRDAIIRAARRTVKPKGYFFNDDFSQRVISRRKELLPDMRDASEREKIAYLSFDRLVVKDRQAHQTTHNLHSHFDRTIFVLHDLTY